jgi:hypothetical protein
MNGTNLIDGLYFSGSTSAVLTVRNVSAARVGAYSVVVTNLFGLAVSADAILQMAVPTITADPVSQSVPLSATAIFSVSASGLGPLSYQWRLNGVNLGNGGNVSGATAPVLTITNVATPNIGTYSAVVSNPYGAATSAVAVLSVYLLGSNNLVQNGGFETGDFTGWNASGSLKDLMVSGNAFYVHSGQFGAQLGPYEYTSLYQNIPTSPGGQYLLSLWLHPDGQGWFSASWNASTVFPSATLPAGGWTNLQFLVAASGELGYLSFQFEDTAAYLGLDDVSINNCTLLSAPAPVPVQILSPHVINGTFAFSFPTLLGQSYTIQENTDLATTNWLLCTNLTGSGALYQFSVPVGGSATRTMFRVREP